MIKKLLILFSFLFLNFYSLKSQVNDRDICEIYSTVIYDLKHQIKENYGQKDVHIIKSPLIINDFVNYLEIYKSFFDDNLVKNNIDYTKFINKANIKEINCNFNNIKIISGYDYYSHTKKYARKKTCVCLFSNIAFYDNYAFFSARIILSYGRVYANFYFLRKNKNRELIFSSIGHD